MNIAEKIEDELILHDLDLLRYEQGTVEEVMVRLTNLQGEIVQAIKELDPTGVGRRAAQRRRLELLLVRVNRRIDRVYKAVLEREVEDLTELALLESRATRRTVNRVIRVPLLSKGLGPKAALELVEEVLIPNDGAGATIREQWGRQSRALKDAIRRSLRGAVDQGRHLVDMLRVIRGSREVRFRDGVLFKTRAQAETLLRTAGAQVVNASRLATYRANSEAVKGLQARAVLDNRTTVLCLTRNGMAWTLDGKRMPGTREPWPGPPPWHYRCRTTLIPIFRSLQALQETIDDPRLNRILEEVGDEYSFDGQPAPTITFDRWLSRRTDASQRKILGKGKWELWKSGKIRLNDLLDQKGHTLTLAELKAKIGED